MSYIARQGSVDGLLRRSVPPDPDQVVLVVQLGKGNTGEDTVGDETADKGFVRALIPYMLGRPR
jgi:hypothetical protein